MSFSTRNMRGTKEPTTTAQIRVTNPYDELRKTATPQLLPTMLRQNTSLTPGQVQITVAHSAVPEHPLHVRGGSLWATNMLKPTTAHAAEPEADWRTHALLSDIPDLSARLTNLDKEIRVDKATSSDSTQQVLRMHNAVLESHDAGLEQQKTSTKATEQRCADLQAQHAKHSNSTRQYLTKTQSILEQHEDRLADLLVAHQAHADSNEETMDLLDATHDVLDAHDTSIASLHDLHDSHAELLRGMTDKTEASQEYLTMAQGILESHDDSIHALQHANRTTAQQLKQLTATADHRQYAELADGHDNTMQYLKLNQNMMETFHRSIDGLQQTSNNHAQLFAGLSGNADAPGHSKLTKQFDEHKIELAALRASLHQVHDELDALHGR